MKWYKKAADQGYANAQLSLGQMYLNGEGVPKNEEEGNKWIRKTKGRLFSE
jgi:TPR repeat protein